MIYNAYRLFLVLFIMTPLLALTACEGEALSSESKEAAQGVNLLQIQTQSGKLYDFDAELALTPQQQAKGLMNRTSMPENKGMLFYMGNEAERGFWMKNTLISLDIIFIKSDGTIHHIHHKAIPHDLTRIPSNGPVAGAFEINGGVAKRLGIKAGDKVIHPFFNQ